MVSSKKKGPSKPNPFLYSREGHLKYSLPYYDLAFCSIVSGGGVPFTAAFFDVILVTEKMFSLFRILVFILICYFFWWNRLSFAWWYENLAYFEAELCGPLSPQQGRSLTSGYRSSIILAAREVPWRTSFHFFRSSRFRFDSGTWGCVEILRPLGVLLFVRHSMMKL